MSDRVITSVTVPFPKENPELLGPYAWSSQKRVKMPKIYPEPGRRKIGIPKQVQATQDRQHLASPAPPGSNKGLANILGSGCWEKQTEANCPEAGQSWWEGGVEGGVAG